MQNFVNENPFLPFYNAFEIGQVSWRNPVEPVEPNLEKQSIRI